MIVLLDDLSNVRSTDFMSNDVVDDSTSSKYLAKSAQKI
jgi:hypothetical protein